MKSQNIIKVKEEIKIGDIVLEKGDRIKVIDESIRDYRNIFLDNPFTLRKAEFSDAKTANLSENMKKALVDIVSHGNVMDFLPNTSAFEDNLFPDGDGIEWVVYVEPYGYFYVDTEGYDYARYIMKIPTDFAENVLEPIWLS